MSRRCSPWRPTDARRRRLDQLLALLEQAHGPRPIPAGGRRKCLDELIASMLAQNTNLANAHSGYKQLRREFSSWTAVMNAPVDAVQRTIAVCGLARLRARRMQRLLRDIKTRHGKLDLQFLADQNPQSAFEHLTSYYGIGPKTAAYTLLFSFNMPLFPVDKGIHRMAQTIEDRPPESRRSGDGSHHRAHLLVAGGAVLSTARADVRPREKILPPAQSQVPAVHSCHDVPERQAAAAPSQVE